MAAARDLADADWTTAEHMAAHPFADRRALSAAEQLGLDSDVDALEKLVSEPGEFARLVAALVRVELDDDHDAALKAAGTS